MKRILLIDDDGDEIVLLNAAMQEAGIMHHCTWAEDVEQAIKLLLKFRPDIVFIDMNMPRIGGIEGIRRIRKHDNGQDVPIILYSTSIDYAARHAALAAGANDCMQKPCQLREFAGKLRGFLEGSGFAV